MTTATPEPTREETIARLAAEAVLAALPGPDPRLAELTEDSRRHAEQIAGLRKRITSLPGPDPRLAELTEDSRRHAEQIAALRQELAAALDSLAGPETDQELPDPLSALATSVYELDLRLQLMERATNA